MQSHSFSVTKTARYFTAGPVIDEANCKMLVGLYRQHLAYCKELGIRPLPKHHLMLHMVQRTIHAGCPRRALGPKVDLSPLSYRQF